MKEKNLNRLNLIDSKSIRFLSQPFQIENSKGKERNVSSRCHVCEKKGGTHFSSFFQSPHWPSNIQSNVHSPSPNPQNGKKGRNNTPTPSLTSNIPFHCSIAQLSIESPFSFPFSRSLPSTASLAALLGHFHRRLYSTLSFSSPFVLSLE